MNKATAVLLGIIGCGLCGLSAQAATPAGPTPVVRELASAGYFGGVKQGMLILSLSNQGRVQTFFTNSAVKVRYLGALADLGSLPLNTPIRVTTDPGGYLLRVEVLGGEK